MSGEETNLPSEATVREMLEVQKSEQSVRLAEIQAQTEHRENQKEFAMMALEASSRDKADDRQTRQKESTKSKLFIAFLSLLFVFVLCFLVVFGEAELVEVLLIEAGKVTLGAVGGAGLASYYFLRRRSDEISEHMS